MKTLQENAMIASQLRKKYITIWQDIFVNTKNFTYMCIGRKI